VWARVPIKFVELFHQLEDLMTPLGNFKYYRQLLAESKDKKPIVPYLVVFLRYYSFFLFFDPLPLCRPHVLCCHHRRQGLDIHQRW
jgi:hypothetical protein